MTPETTKNTIAVMQAYANGKPIQICDNNHGEWRDVELPTWDWVHNDYRIKPDEPTYRPYEDTAEMVEDFIIRFKAFNIPSHALPLIWVQGKGVMARRLMVVGYDVFSVHLAPYVDEFDLSELFELYTYLDGTPCGKKAE